MAAAPPAGPAAPVSPVSIDELRRLIVDAAPDPALAEPALTCPEDALLDGVIPFSSLIVLGVIVAVEDTYGIRITKAMLAEALTGGATLRKLAAMIDAAREARA
jgi:acyl carrier protein